MEKEEVAEKLDLTIPALKARLHRIRYALREHLGSAA
jgi:DNA-directed RNA polymerase specialized sigma24 family protein